MEEDLQSQTISYYFLCSIVATAGRALCSGFTWLEAIFFIGLAVLASVLFGVYIIVQVQATP